MKNEKIKLQKLKLSSFVTSLTTDKKNTIHGGGSLGDAIALTSTATPHTDCSLCCGDLEQLN